MFEYLITALVVGQIALIVNVYYRVGRVEQKVCDIMKFLVNGSSVKLKKRRKH